MCIVRKLETRVTLTQSDRDALLSLNWREKSYDAGAFLIREGSEISQINLLLDGFAYRQKIDSDGARQILAFLIPGDLVDLQGLLLRVSDHNVQFLTRCTVAEVAKQDIINLIDNNPNIARALWLETLIDGSMLRQWLMNVGRKQGRQRLAHLFCEFATRLKAAGLGDEQGYNMPITQEQLGDATGLSPVHVSRSLKALEVEGLIKRDGRNVNIPNWDSLRREAGYNELYWHFDQSI